MYKDEHFTRLTSKLASVKAKAIKNNKERKWRSYILVAKASKLQHKERAAEGRHIATVKEF